MATDLITLDYYLATTDSDATQLDTDTHNQYTQAIAVASALVRSYCERDFTLNTDAVQGVRSFRYRGHGMLEIDDCTSVTQVAIQANQWQSGRTLDASEWFPMDVDADVLSYLEIYSVYQFVSGSPAMGFKRNLDNYPQRFYPTMLSVTAVWGWPTIPVEVEMATAFTVTDLTSGVINGLGVAESSSQGIASFHTSSSSRGRILLPESALPYKAQAMLDRYAKWSI